MWFQLSVVGVYIYFQWTARAPKTLPVSALAVGESGGKGRCVYSPQRFVARRCRGEGVIHENRDFCLRTKCSPSTKEAAIDKTADLRLKRSHGVKLMQHGDRLRS